MRFQTEYFRLLGLALLCVFTAGCATFGRLPGMEVGSTWASKEGKAQSELYKDQQECTRKVKMMRAPVFPGEISGGTEEIRAFDSCMRSKGWVKR